MAFDGFFMKRMVAELSEEILNSRINKINNLSKDEFIFSIRQRKNLKLFISANPTSSRIQLTDTIYENPNTPSNFCTVFRKYLLGGIITNIQQINNDRILYIHIKNFDELGYEKHFILILELMGKHSNIILTTDELIIIDSLKNSYDLEFKRATISNMKYSLPPTVKKINPFSFKDYPEISDGADNNKYLMQQFYGVSSLLNNYLKGRTARESVENLKEFCMNFDSLYSPAIFNEKNKTDFYFFDVNNKDSNTFPTLSNMLDVFYMDSSKESTNKNTDKYLFDFVKNKLSRLNNKLIILNKELISSFNKDDYKLMGQLLISNIYLFKKSVPEKVTLQNFYSENLEDITISLDTSLSIEQNAENYFNLYKKNNRTIDNLNIQINITKQEIEYFQNIQFQLDYADKTDISEIKSELVSEGYLKEKINTKKKQKNKYLIVNYDDTSIYVGKNNIQNDTITNKLAKRNYLWFHAKDVPGSHVVIFSNNPNNNTIKIAAMLAGYFSKLKNEDNIDIDMTLIKNVKKISGAKPGFVTYTDQKTIKTRIDKILINKLLN